MPQSKNRNCARHIYTNQKKNHPSLEFKNLFWRAIKSTTKADLIEYMNKIKVIFIKAHDDFNAVEFEKFYMRKVVHNNLSECFTGYILNVRTNHLTNILEDIRRAMMKRIAKKKEKIL